MIRIKVSEKIKQKPKPEQTKIPSDKKNNRIVLPTAHAMQMIQKCCHASKNYYSKKLMTYRRSQSKTHTNILYKYQLTILFINVSFIHRQKWTIQLHLPNICIWSELLLYEMLDAVEAQGTSKSNWDFNDNSNN